MSERPTAPPEDLLGIMVELDALRSAVAGQFAAMSPDPDQSSDGGSDLEAALRRARSAMIANPAGAKRAFDWLAELGRAYAATPEGADLQAGLVASEEVDGLRRVWETVSLNALDGDTTETGMPHAWLDLMSDAMVGDRLEQAIAPLRPPGFA